MLSIVYEDAFCIAVNKPAGQAVIPGRNLDKSSVLVHETGRYLGKKAFVVHRLDRETSGLVLFAKTPSAHRVLCMQFEKREVKKAYLSVAEGTVAAGGEIDTPLREFGSGRSAADPSGKPSKTRFRVLERLRGATLLEVEPCTGRRHQIRAHLYSIGHPVLGDRLYGKNRPVGGVKRLMLHALQLSFRHPESNAMIDVRAETDTAWEALIGGLRGDPQVPG
jgi:tRNA pseudouridine32 synthase/23S rRNA pseudouridine746 synthase